MLKTNLNHLFIENDNTLKYDLGRAGPSVKIGEQVGLVKERKDPLM